MKKAFQDWFTGVTSNICSGASGPTIPTFTNFHLLSTGDGSPIEVGETDGKKELLIPAPWPGRIGPNGLNGTAIAPYKWKSETDSQPSEIGGDTVTTGQQILRSLNGSGFNEYYNFRILGNSNSAITGISGVTAEATTENPNYKFVNLPIKNVSFAGFLINENTASQGYGTIDIEYCRVDGYDTEGEGIYIGSTANPSLSPVAQLNITHNGISNKGRDGIQSNGADGLLIKKNTVYKVGVLNDNDQEAFLQIQNHTGSQGIVSDNLCYLAPKGFNIFAHNMHLINNYMVLDANAKSSYIGKQSVYEAGDNQPLIFENFHFGSIVPITNYISIVEDQCNITFLNCTKDSNVTNIFVDNRADKVTYSITETGTTVVASQTPTFASTDVYSDNFLKNTNQYFCTRKVGRYTAN